MDQRTELDEYLQTLGQGPIVTEEQSYEKAIDDWVDSVFHELPNHYNYLERNPKRQEMYSYLESILTKVGVPHKSDVREVVLRNVLNEIYSYPTEWQKVMDDDSIYEIKVYASNDSFEGQAIIRRMFVKGVIDRSELIMTEKQLERFLRRKWVGTGFIFDPTHPASEGMFPDGSRVHVRHGAVGYTVPDENGRPMVRSAMVITVRKFPKPLDLDMLEDLQYFSPEMKEYSIACGRLTEGVIFCGPTGSGKSTHLGAWLKTLPANEEVGVTEDGNTDLQPLHGRVGRLWTRRPNNEGRGEITLRQNTLELLRMNYDHIAVGETKTGEVAAALTDVALSGKGIVTTTMHVRQGGDGRRAVRRFLNLLGRAEGWQVDYRSSADIFADSFRHLVIADDTYHGLRVRYMYEVGAFDWDANVLPLYLVASWDESTDTFHFHGVTKRFAERAKQRRVPLNLPVDETHVEFIRFG